MNQTMKAAVFQDIEMISTEQKPIPDCPEDGLLIRVHACGICGSDVRNYHSGLKNGVKNQILGHEIAGEIVETGKNVTVFQRGERVALAPDVSCGSCYYCKHGLVNLCQHHRMLGTHYPGGYAQYISLPAEVIKNGFVERIPPEMPYEHAAFAETAAAVVACQKRIGISMGDRILIFGDGPVGCLHAEIARARGASFIAIAGMDRLSLAEQFTPDLLLNNHFPENVKIKALEATEGIGFDFIICAVPSITVQEQALELCRKRGTIVIYGGVPKQNQLSHLNSNTIHYNELTITGSFSYPSTGLSDAISAIRCGHIKASRYISKIISLEEIPEGIKLIETGEALKIIIDPWKTEPQTSQIM